jgi:hypothetical protein
MHARVQGNVEVFDNMVGAILRDVVADPAALIELDADFRAHLALQPHPLMGRHPTLLGNGYAD